QIRYAERRGIPYVWFPASGESGDEVKDIRSGEQVPADASTWTPPAEDLVPAVTRKP
ncbi:MAG TPA: histidine--tRNA ligase, partial [Intrasporangium sp.]|nr:histidine--tRNA ligase [Intrasporangium sp.]